MTHTIKTLLCFASFLLVACTRHQPTADVLVSQLHGGECRFLFEPSTRKCESVGFFTSLNIRSFKYRCIGDAALCLGELKFSSSLPTLMTFLEAGMNDVDSGDGLIPVRSTVAGVVALLGNSSAISSLEKALQRNDETVRSDTGTFPLGYTFEKGTSHQAIRAALEKLKGK